MPNLGELLSANMQREKDAAHDIAAAWDQMRTDEARKNFTAGKKFFDDAKDYFTNGITNQEEVKNLFLQVGGNGITNRYGSKVDCHVDFSAVMDCYKKHPTLCEPASLSDPKRFAALWTDFQRWAVSSGLVAYWTEGTDGGGQDNWWYLHVKPAPRNSRGGVSTAN